MKRGNRLRQSPGLPTKPWPVHAILPTSCSVPSVPSCRHFLSPFPSPRSGAVLQIERITQGRNNYGKCSSKSDVNCSTQAAGVANVRDRGPRVLKRNIQHFFRAPQKRTRALLNIEICSLKASALAQGRKAKLPCEALFRLVSARTSVRFRYGSPLSCGLWTLSCETAPHS